MRLETNKDDNHIYKFSFKTFDYNLKYSFQSKIKIIKLSKIFKNGRAENHFINYLEYNKLRQFSDYQALKNLSDSRTLNTANN